MWIAIALLSGCSLSASRSGLIDVNNNQVAMVAPSGQTYRLITDDFTRELSHLGGCVVEVSGPRVGNRLYVRQWKVTDAGDGSQPFVGPLMRVGARWALDDWSTGTTVILTSGQLTGISAYLGDPVLVVGVVTGPQEVRVMSWRALSGDEEQPQR